MVNFAIKLLLTSLFSNIYFLTDYLGTKPRRPPSRCGNRPGTSRSVESPICSNDVVLERPLSRHRPTSSSSLDRNRFNGARSCGLARQNAVSIDDDFTAGCKNNSTDVPLPPRPPSRPPSRPLSRRSRPPSAKGRSRSLDTTNIPTVGLEHEKPPLQSSFSKYKLLPSIGSNSTTLNDYVYENVSTERYQQPAGTCSDGILSQEIAGLSLDLKQKVADAPSEVEPAKVKLAIKLLDGSRHEHWFQNTDTLGDVLAFAESVSCDVLPSCHFCTSEVPRQVFTDMSVTVKDAGLQSRSVLYLEES